jgi:hypothetical protein
MFDESTLPASLRTPEYHWWRRALMRERLPTFQDAPESGFYKWQGKPVAIWTDPQFNEKVAKIAGGYVDMITVRRNWYDADGNGRGICHEPVSPAVYRKAVTEGKWPGESAVAKAVNKQIDATTTEQMAAVTESKIVEVVERTIEQLTNNPPPEGPQLLVSNLDELERDANRLIALGAATTQDRADEAAKLADVIDKIEKKVNDFHKTSKAPHLEAGKVIDRLWFPLRDRASDLKKKLKLIVITPFLKADKITRDDANAALVAMGADPSSITAAKPKAAGNTHTTALRTVAKAVIFDEEALLSHLCGHPEIAITMQKIANASARAGITLPGMRIEHDQVAV